LGKWKGAVQYHRANVNHGYETVITAVGREMLSKARIGFGLGIVENGHDETAHVEAFSPEALESGERRLPKNAREWMARLPIPPTYDTEREAIETALSCIGLTPPERARVIRIKNTLMLGEIEVSEAFSPDLANRPDLTPLGEPVPLTFDAAGRLASR